MANTDARLEYLQFLEEWHSPCHYIVAHTSGSTGKPKPIHLSKADMRRSAETAIRMFGVSETSVIASALPTSSIATKMAIVRSVVAGCTYLPVQPSNRPEFACHVDLLSVGPSQTDALVDSSLVGTVLSGGAPLSAERRIRLLEAGFRLVETYGMTETCSNVALRLATDDFFTANPDIFFSLDARGCLVIHADGYTFDGMATNDMAELLSPTRFRLLGRYDNAINSGGIKIHPELLERDLAPLISAPFYITSAPSTKWGQEVVLVIEGNAEDAARTREAIEAYPDKFRRPKHVLAIAKIPLTSTGKPKRILPDYFLSQ